MGYKIEDSGYTYELDCEDNGMLLTKMYIDGTLSNVFYVCQVKQYETKMNAGCFKKYSKEKQSYDVQFSIEFESRKVEIFTNKLLNFIEDKIRDIWSMNIWIGNVNKNKHTKLIYDLSFASKNEAVYIKLVDL